LFATIFAVLGLLWLYAWQRRREDPVAGAVFRETMISGCSRRDWLTRLGGARNCLEVFVTPERVLIRPVLLFDLPFLTGLYGLRQDFPRRAVVAAERKDGFFTKTVLIRWRGEDGEDQEFELSVSKPDELVALLAPVA
jgi:hypothetical protein